MTLHRLFPAHVVACGYLAGFFISVALLASAYYFEYQMFLEPCPLCIVQRIATLGIGVGCLLAFFARNTRWPQIAALLFTLMSGVFGTWVANRHIWIQGLPEDQVPACGPSLDYMMEILPINELITFMLQGSGSCADVAWQFVGMSMPEWTRVIFIAFTLVTLLGLARAWSTKP